MIFRLSFLVVAAVTAFAVSHQRQNASTQRRVKDDSSLGWNEEVDEELADESLAEEIQEQDDAAVKADMGKDTIQEKKVVYEMGCLRHLVTQLSQGNATLERKLHELHGVEEQQTYSSQLQRNLAEKKAEIDELKSKISSLEDENEAFRKGIKDGMLAEKQLEMANLMIEQMQRKLDSKTKHLKSQLLILTQEQVSGFESTVSCNRVIMSDDKLRSTGLELHELRRENKELELEKRELTVKLMETGAKIANLSNLTEGKIIAEAGKELSTLKSVNEELSERVEELQRNRFDLVEELVYQRWLNTCLRFESHSSHQTPSRKLSTDQKSHEKIEPLMLDPAFDSFSSLTSSTESDKYDSHTTESSSSSQKSTRKKVKHGLIHRIKKWGKSNAAAVSYDERSSRGNALSRNGLVRRFSTSMIPSKPAMQYEGNDRLQNTSEKEPTKSLKPSNCSRVRRVSFSDSVRTAASPFKDDPKSVEEVWHDKEISSENSSHSSTPDSCLNYDAGPAKERKGPSSSQPTIAEADNSIDVKAQPCKKDNRSTGLDDKIERTRPEETHSKTMTPLAGENKTDIHIVQLMAVVFIFCCILLLLASTWMY